MRTRWAWLALSAAAIVAAVVVIALIRQISDGGTSLRSTPSVVIAIRDLARLETVEYHVERVIDLRDRQSLLFGLLKTQDAILFVAVGQVTAGVDLGELGDGDVVADRTRGTVQIILPPARVLSTRLDNEKSWVYTRTTDPLAQRHEDLETRARQEAERTLEQSAVTGGILDRARINAEHTVASLVRSLGYTTVTVTSRAPQTRDATEDPLMSTRDGSRTGTRRAPASGSAPSRAPRRPRRRSAPRADGSPRARTRRWWTPARCR